MGSQILNNQHPVEFIDSKSSTLISKESLTQINKEQKSFEFNVFFSGYVDMFSALETVAEYLAAHQNWFCRCAKPMNVEPFGKDGYLLNIGKFNSLGYEVEPKIAVLLDPPQDNLYLMRTVPVPDQDFLGYEVKYQSLMELTEIQPNDIKVSLRDKIFASKPQDVPNSFTRLSWQLDLVVLVEFPNFITRFPRNLIQKSGDHLVAQIVRQVSPRLSYKVQQDFHHSLGLKTPYKNCRGLTQFEDRNSFNLRKRKRKGFNSKSPAMV